MKPATISPSLISPVQEQSVTAPTQPRAKFGQVLREKGSDRTSTTEQIVQHVGEYVDRVGSDQKRIDRAISNAASGRNTDAVELLRIQTLIYGQSQRVELASKCVQQATSGVKQLLNTQV